jgi:TrmH family RNA methyltransferase
VSNISLSAAAAGREHEGIIITETGLVAEFAQARADPRLAVLEGFHPLKHALRFGAQLTHVVTPDAEGLEQLAADLAPDLRGVFRRLAIVVSADTFRQLSKNLLRTEVIAVAVRPAIDVDQVLQDPSPRPIVFLEEPRNLGNMGAAVRVAAAAGAAGVLMSGRNDPWDPMVIRGSAGLHYALPVAAIPELDPHDRPVVALDPDGRDVEPGAVPDRAVLAFGTERHGLTREVLRRADLRIRIPMQRGVSSLNLATAVAVVLYSRRWSA